MKFSSRLKKSRHGIYYFRLQLFGIDKRWSLNTRDPKVASFVALKLNATIAHMKIDPKNIRGWTLISDGNRVEMKTEDNDSDRKSAAEFLLAQTQLLLSNQNTIAEHQVIQTAASVNPIAPIASNAKLVTIETAINEYKSDLENQVKNSEITNKTKLSALSVLTKLSNKLGPDFQMSQITNEIIEDYWLTPRLDEIATLGGSNNTAKKDLSFINRFIDWASNRKRKYSFSKLTLNIDRVKAKSYLPFNTAELKLIFDNLPKHSRKPWHLWVPILELYTGARIGEIAALKTSYVTKISGIDVLHIEGTKTDSSVRDIPIHPDLIRLGFLDLVNQRKSSNQNLLFDIVEDKNNGWGAAPSEFFTNLKKSLGINDPRKCSHSFRHTLIHHMIQNGVDSLETRCAYVGHDAGGGVHNDTYAKNAISISKLNDDVINKIDWKKFCNWELDFECIKNKIRELAR